MQLHRGIFPNDERVTRTTDLYSLFIFIVQLKRCQTELKTEHEKSKAVETLQKNHDELKQKCDSLMKDSKEVRRHDLITNYTTILDFTRFFRDETVCVVYGVLTLQRGRRPRLPV